MGVRGLRTYLESKELLLEHRLQSVNLIIDGNNLVYYLNHYIQHCIQNDHMYGGDYMVSSEQLRCLFGKFSKCNIKPIIVFDGSIDPNMQKLSVTLERHLNKHRISHKIYQNNFLIEGLKPLLFKEIFIKEAENASFPIIQVMHEADHFIIEIANELNSPILSNDSDFLIYNLPAGVIITDTLRFDQPLSKDQNQHYYINCKIYHISDLKRHHPKLNLNLVQIIGFLLGNDYVNICERIPFLKQIKQSKNNKNIFGKTLRWISSFNDLQSLLIKLSIIFNSEHHQIIKLIKRHFLTLKSVDDRLKNGLINVQSQSFNSDNHLLDYLDRKKQTIIRQMKFPEILGHAYVDAKISSRIISIRFAHLNMCSTYVEDFSFEESIHHATKDLNTIIYGLLRRQNENPALISRYCRKKQLFKKESIKPVFIIKPTGNHKDSEQVILLPMIEEIVDLDSNHRESLLFDILKIEMKIFEAMKNFFIEDSEQKFKFNYKHQTAFITMMLILFYFLRNFPYDIWIEFIYAIYLNLWFGDYLFPIECSMRFLSFKSSDDDNLVHKIENNLRRFYQLPKLSHSKLFIPRIVHFYNCFQVCLEDIKLASKILLVNQLFDFDSMIDRLSGIFIYNLTVELSSRSQPLLYIQELLLRDQFYPMKIFIDLLQFIMVQSERNFLLKSRKFFDNIVPSSLPSIDASALNESDNNSKQSLLVRGFEVTNRQTHINSQRLKIHKKGQSRL